MSKNAKSLWIQEEVGGPEEDRTPDLLIANDVEVKNINNLHHCASAVNSPKSQCVCTNRAQAAATFGRRHSRRQLQRTIGRARAATGRPASCLDREVEIITTLTERV